MSSSVRAQVAAMLAPFVSDEWTVKPHTVKQVDTLARPTLFIEHTGIDPLEVSPFGHVQSTVVVTVLSHLTDYSKAEDALDVPVLELITDLDTDDRLEFRNARKTSVHDTYLGWAIELTVITAKETGDA
ncbi:hypothetical protein [Microbacterium immunditiarum]|uniref:DUF3168 domain-containing protein n=1 Tax=Microbacterium immunditiarum TaxID=337480 RepID=A0A7Y9KM71_9MICO|nr:hypothetical protein [Microbacterium immunditiarum]NYE20514.1 hypothetical protein [Microbacterium immunditiarum]